MRLSRLESSLILGSRGPFLHPDDGTGGGGGAGQEKEPTSGEKEGDGKETDGFKPITTEAELAAYKKDLRENITKDVRKAIRTELEQERKDADDKAKRDRESEEAKAKGDFEKVETQLKSDLETATTERAALKDENTRLREAMTTGLKAAWDALPEQVRKMGEKQHGDEDVLGRWTFVHDADTVALVTSLTGKAPINPGNPQNPRTAGTSAVEITPLISKSAALG